VSDDQIEETQEDAMPPFAAVMAYTAMTGSVEEIDWASKLIAQLSANYMTTWDGHIAKGVDDLRAYELVTEVFNAMGVEHLQCVGLGDAIEDLVREHQKTKPDQPLLKKAKLIVPPSVANGEAIHIPHT
jgi:hypothetical protein